MKESYWVNCPICHNKTRTKIRKDTELHRFPLFCPKCKQETRHKTASNYSYKRARRITQSQEQQG